MATNAEEPTDEPNETTPLPVPEQTTEMAEPATPPLAPTGPTPPAETTLPVDTSIRQHAQPAGPWSPASAAVTAQRLRSSGPPPVRWGGIIWGALLIVFAVVTLTIVSSPARLADVTVWIATLTPGAALAVWIAVLGLLIVVSALVAAISAAQRNRSRRLR